jgi:hypothetical protein
VVVQEVRRGCEAVALAVIAALAGGNAADIGVPAEVLAGPAELVSRGLGIEQMLRSIHVGHSHATAAVLQAVERLVPEELRFGEMRRASSLIFRVVGEVSAPIDTKLRSGPYPSLAGGRPSGIGQDFAGVVDEVGRQPGLETGRAGLGGGRRAADRSTDRLGLHRTIGHRPR